MIKKIDFRENIMDIDGNILKFPISIAEVEEVLGPPEVVINKEDYYEIHYVYHEHGIVFEALENNTKWLKARKIYADSEHNIIVAILYCGDTVRPMTKETVLPNSTCKATITYKGGINMYFISDRAEADDMHIIRWPQNVNYNPDGEAIEIVDPLSVSYCPKITHKSGSYKIKKCKEEVLEFDNFNFKLAIIQVLMYDLEVLEPYFDIFDFAEQYEGKEIDVESYEPIRPALNFFKKLPIPKRLAEKVEEIDMYGSEIYMNIIPQWDGEDGYFDLNQISVNELKQFANLKKATIMSENYDEVSQVFKNFGIDVTQ